MTVSFQLYILKENNNKLKLRAMVKTVEGTSW